MFKQRALAIKHNARKFSFLIDGTKKKCCNITTALAERTSETRIQYKDKHSHAIIAEYKGEICKQGKRNGFGELYATQQEYPRYTGEFSNDLFAGIGKIEYAKNNTRTQVLSEATNNLDNINNVVIPFCTIERENLHFEGPKNASSHHVHAIVKQQDMTFVCS